jgi:DNA (cytosine-5)-methyltransferase 1
MLSGLRVFLKSGHDLVQDAENSRKGGTNMLNGRTMTQPSAKTSNFVGIDLFSGAGGMTLGARLAGIDVLASVENDKHAVATYRHNNPGVEIFDKDIRQYSSVPETLPTDVRVLFGGAPCQGFSTSNQRTRSASNQSNWLFAEFLRVADLWQPDWVIFENVKGIVETAKGVFLERIMSEITKRGYTAVHFFLQAADFGVPQRRTRLFIVGSRAGIKVKMPQPITSDAPTVWEAISDLPLLKNGASTSELPYRGKPQTEYQIQMRDGKEKCTNNLVSRNLDYVIRRYGHIPQGGNWENIPNRLMKNYQDKTNCHTGIYLRLRANRVSVVIGNFRKNMLIHPTQDRGLSVREAARLQSFPDSYQFKGSIGFQQQQVGNAVPPLLAKAVFESVIHGHLGEARTQVHEPLPLSLTTA